MSTPLTGHSIQSSYSQLLIINVGIVSSLHNVADGFGNDSALQISNVAAAINGELFLNSTGTGVVPVLITAFAGQTADLFEIKDSSGLKRLSVDNTYQLAFPNAGGPIYFGNFFSPSGTASGFSIPGSVIFAVDTSLNAAFFGFGSFGGGVNVVFIGNRTTPPGSNPVGGGLLYAEGGALKWRGSGGTVTTIAPA